MKKNYCLWCVIFLSINLYSVEIKSLADFSKRKIEYYCEENIELVQQNIDKDLKDLSLNKNKFKYELFLTLENNLVIEKINFMPQENDVKKEIYLIVNNQILKNELYLENKKLKELSSDYIVSVADLNTRALTFLTNSKKYSQAMLIKDYYTQAIKNNNKNSNAYLGYGLWLYFAPPIVGGGYKEAYKKILLAEKNAKNDEELYFILIYKSQILFALNQKEDAKKILKQAHSLFKKETFTKMVEGVNEKGKIFFD